MKTEKLGSLQIIWLRGSGLRKSDIVDNGPNSCILYGELFTKYKDILIENAMLSKTGVNSGTKSKAGDILVPGTSTAAKSEMVRARVVETDGILIGGDINIIRPEPNLFNAKYLAYFFETHDAKKQLDRYITGTTGIIHISNSGIKNLVIPIVSLEEQRRIVMRLDKAFEKLTRALELTEKNVTNATILMDNYLSQLYDGNELMTQKLGTAVDKFLTGPFGSALHKSDYVIKGTPVVNPQNIVNGRIVASEKTLISDEKVEELSRYKLKTGDIVVARRGEMGRCAYVESEQEGWLCGTGCFVLRLKQGFDPQYISELLQVKSTRELLEEKAVGTTMKNLNQSILLSLEINIPEYQEQIYIYDKSEEVKAAMIKTVGLYKQKIGMLNALKQSILTQAFSMDEVN